MGLVVLSSEKITVEKSLRLSFLTTNNEAKYEALLEGMAMVQKMGRRIVEANSRLVIGQIKGELEARDLRMQEYLSRAKLSTCSQVLKLSLCSRSRGGEIHILLLWLLRQPPRHKVYLTLSYLNICISPLRQGRRRSKFTRLE